MKSLEDVVTNVREWRELADLTGIPYIGEQLDGNTVSFYTYRPIKGCSFKGKQLYEVLEK